ncbi:dockerin type I repeat-containing protein [Singulisphaera sp. PoT]|uniref:dockerin type I repeat-containing protein n=1 Tax=Singulisphaera sp. PoT TaxID=3411797 RepID=UPI003BF5F09D
MSSLKMRYKPTFDVFEVRIVPSAAVPANTLAVATGVVQSPRAIAHASVPLSERNLSGRRSAILSELVSPGEESSLKPAVTGATGTNGRALAIRRGAPFVPGRHEAAAVFIRAGNPGTVTTGVTGQDDSTGSFQVGATLPGDVNGDGQVTLADEVAFAKAYNSTTKDANYNPAADANHNGQVGIGDAQLLLRNLQLPTPKIPLTITFALAPQDAARGSTPKNSGGKTRFKDVTILGHTTPGAMVFMDGTEGTYTFTGAALPADAHGNFSVNVSLTRGINSYQFMAIDGYGQQTIMAYPIYWLSYAASGSTLK